jgi:Helix-turn-helix
MAVTKLRLRILEDGRPQYVIAAASGLPPPRISEYALGKRVIPPHHLIELVRVFGCDPVDIVGFVEEDSLAI